MAGLSGLAKMLKQSSEKKEKTTEERVLGVIDKFLVASPEDKGKEPRVDRLAFRPSGIHKCARELYYFLTREEGTERNTARSMRILEVGTALHEWIQTEVFMEIDKLDKFPIKLLSSEDMPTYGTEGISYLKEHNAPPMEIKFLDSRWTKKFPVSAMVDGAFTFDNTDMLFEFKTINTKDFSMLIEPKKEHKLQGAIYVLCTGIKNVMFMYLDKNTQELKSYIVNYTDEQLDWIVSRMQDIESHVERGEIPDKEVSQNCRWCKYTKSCKRDTNEEVIEDDEQGAN